LSKLDIEVHNHLVDADMEPFFCLSWIFTWFAHDVPDTQLVKRIFDFFIVGHPLVLVYTALSMMTHPYNRRLISETDCDFAALHQCLASLPKHSCQVGYKVRPSDGPFGMDNDLITYMSDYEDEDDKQHQHDGGEEQEKDTRIINTPYLEEEQS